jgi:hypothetical protein
MRLPPGTPPPPAQHVDLIGAQLAPRSRPQRFVAQFPDRDPHEALHRMPDPMEHLPDLVGLPLADHDPPPRVQTRRRGTHQRQRLRRNPYSVENRATNETRPRRGIGHPLHLHVVLAQHAVAGMADAQRQLAVVGEQHQPLGVEIQPPDRKHPLADSLAHEIEDGRPSLGIGSRGHHARGLVKQEVPRGLRRLEPLAVDLHRVGRRIGLIAEGGGAPVDRDPAFADERFRVAPRAHPGAGNQLLETFKGH